MSAFEDLSVDDSHTVPTQKDDFHSDQPALHPSIRLPVLATEGIHQMKWRKESLR